MTEKNEDELPSQERPGCSGERTQEGGPGRSGGGDVVGAEEDAQRFRDELAREEHDDAEVDGDSKRRRRGASLASTLATYGRK